MLIMAIQMFEDIGRLSMAAKHYKVIHLMFLDYQLFMEEKRAVASVV